MSTRAKHPQEQSPAAPAMIPIARHHAEIHGAYSLGADCVNRLSTMVTAGLQIANAANPPIFQVSLLADFLKECQYLSEDLAGTIECERDTQAQLARDTEAK